MELFIITIQPSKERALSIIRIPLLCKKELGKCIKGQIIDHFASIQSLQFLEKRVKCITVYI